MANLAFISSRRILCPTIPAIWFGIINFYFPFFSFLTFFSHCSAFSKWILHVVSGANTNVYWFAFEHSFCMSQLVFCQLKCVYSSVFLHANKLRVACVAGVGLPETCLQLGLRGLWTTGPRRTEGRDGSSTDQALWFSRTRSQSDLHRLPVLFRRQRERYELILHQHLTRNLHLQSGSLPLTLSLVFQGGCFSGG